MSLGPLRSGGRATDAARKLQLHEARQSCPPAGVSFKAINPSFSRILGGHEKLQLVKRLPAPFIRHLLVSHRVGQRSAKAAMTELADAWPVGAGQQVLWKKRLRIPPPPGAKISASLKVGGARTSCALCHKA